MFKSKESVQLNVVFAKCGICKMWYLQNGAEGQPEETFQKQTPWQPAFLNLSCIENGQ